MSTYRVAEMVGVRQIRLFDWERPRLLEDEVAVKVLACALCTWELRVYSGERKMPFPAYMGHEISAEVVEIGSAVRAKVAIGDRVAVSRISRCGSCVNCRSGNDNRCLNMGNQYRAGRPPGPAGLAEYLFVPGYQVYRLPPTTDPVAAALVEPVACCIGSVDKAEVTFGDVVLVVGAGTMGLIHVALLKSQGAVVVVSEPDADRRAKALEFGADMAVDSTKLEANWRGPTDGLGFSAVFVTGGPGRVVPQVLPQAAGGSTIVLYSSYSPQDAEAALDLNRLHHAEIRLVGTVSPRKHDFQRAARLLGQGLELGKLVEARYRLDQITEAFEHALQPGSYRIVVEMP